MKQNQDRKRRRNASGPIFQPFIQPFVQHIIQPFIQPFIQHIIQPFIQSFYPAGFYPYFLYDKTRIRLGADAGRSLAGTSAPSLPDLLKYQYLFAVQIMPRR